MSDRQQQQPLKKATPRQNNNAQMLQNITVGLENFGLKINKKSINSTKEAQDKINQPNNNQGRQKDENKKIESQTSNQLQEKVVASPQKKKPSQENQNQTVFEQQQKKKKSIEKSYLVFPNKQKLSVSPLKQQVIETKKMNPSLDDFEPLSDNEYLQQQDQQVFIQDENQKYIQNNDEEASFDKKDQEKEQKSKSNILFEKNVINQNSQFEQKDKKSYIGQQKSEKNLNQLLTNEKDIKRKKNETQKSPNQHKVTQSSFKQKSPQLKQISQLQKITIQKHHQLSHQKGKVFEIQNQTENIDQQIQIKKEINKNKLNHHINMIKGADLKQSEANKNQNKSFQQVKVSSKVLEEPKPVISINPNRSSKTLKGQLLFEQIQEQMQRLQNTALIQQRSSPKYTNQISSSEYPLSSVDNTRINYDTDNHNVEKIQNIQRFGIKMDSLKDGQGRNGNKIQSNREKQQLQCFDLAKYREAQLILQELLLQLKQIFRIIKEEKTNPPVAVQNRTSNSKFIGRPNRTESRNKSSSLMDILERRKQGKNQDAQSYFTQNHIPKSSSRQDKSNFLLPHGSGRPKIIPVGLGNLGQPVGYSAQVMRNQPYFLKKNDTTEQSHDSNLQTQEQQKQRLIKNRNKINQILASSVSSFKKPVANKNKDSSGSFFIRQHHTKNNNEKNQESSFIPESQNSSKHNFHSRKIIKSNNFNKIYPKQVNSVSEIPSSKATINNQKPFFSNQSQRPTLTSITSILKIIKKYLQVIAEGRIDQIETFLHNVSDGSFINQTLNEIINRKKLFKTALYYQRAAIVGGVCFGYLMITEERGYLQCQVQSLVQKNTRDQNSKQLSQSLKEQTKQILKYMINLTSFSLNNCKLITKTITDYFITPPQTKNPPPLQAAKIPLRQHQQQQLIQKQIYKRNIETIRLNIQYIQQTLQKLFVECRNPSMEEDFGESFKNVTKIIHKNSIQESFYTLLEYFSFYLCLTRRQKSIPFLSVAPNPYIDTTERYTLVIDFICVFCHGSKKSKTFIFRPYSQHFLIQMSQYFDIVVINDALPQQIDKIIDILDPKKIIQHRLYKYHMVEQRATGKFVKNLERIGRDMKKMILLDVQDNRIQLNSTKNTIYINQWKGSRNDSVLAELCSVLISIVVNGLDCSQAATKIDNQMKINYRNGIKHVNYGLDLRGHNNGDIDEEDQQSVQWQEGHQQFL